MYYKIFTNCEIVDGYNRSLVYDLQREKIIQIPKKLSQVLKKNNGKEIQSVYDNIDKIDYEEVKKYIDLLIGEDIFYISKKPINDERFPKIEYNHSKPNTLSNIIITLFIKDDINKFIKSIINIINSTKCRFIQIRFEKGFSTKNIKIVLESFKESIIKGISIVIDNANSVNSNLEDLVNKYPRILNVIIYNYTTDIDFINKKEYDHIEFVKASYSDFPHFKELNDLRFLNMNPNILKFSEAQKYNLLTY